MSRAAADQARSEVCSPGTCEGPNSRTPTVKGQAALWESPESFSEKQWLVKNASTFQTSYTGTWRPEGEGAGLTPGRGSRARWGALDQRLHRLQVSPGDDLPSTRGLSPVAAVALRRKLSGLKQHRFILLGFWRPGV